MSHSEWPEASDDVRAKLTSAWNVRGIDLATIQVDRSGTIATPSAMAPPDSAMPFASSANLPTMGDEHLDASIADVELTETIGEGGMGIVWAARQVPLRREVAVKSVHPNAPQHETTRALLREARVTGGLEHPNIVPVHALGRDEKGRPIIVMKRIEGTTWADLLEQQHAQGPGSVIAQLSYHLEVLVDVAKAIHFAHSRKVLHRDIKPDNVMIGGFGEVYVVDWGIAAALEGREGIDLPLASAIREITGSPAYMSPEMAIGDGDHIGPATDVYLLGATLHEVLTGLPPHIAATPVEMLTNAYASNPPSYDASIPAELAAIARRAMARIPSERFPTAAAFAAAIQRFLSHRDSHVLTDEGVQHLERLRERLAVGRVGDEDRRRLYAEFNRCRFALEHALKIWPDNQPAQDQLQAALEAMIEHELAAGSPGAAEALLGELPIPMPRLASRIASHKEVERNTRFELDELRHQVDPTLSDRPRALLALAVALTWPLLHGLLFYVEVATAYGVGWVVMTSAYGLYVISSVAVGVAQRETLLSRGSAGVQTQLVNTLGYIALMALWPVAHALEITSTATYPLVALMASAMWLVGAIAVDRRFLAWGMSMVLAVALCLVRPDESLIWLGVAGFVGSGVLGLLRLRTKTLEDSYPLSQAWSRPRPEREDEARATRRA